MGKSIGGDAATLKGAGDQGGSAQRSRSKKNTNGTVNPSETREILAFVDWVLVYALEKGLDDNVPNELRKDTVCQEQQTVHGKVPDPNGIVNSGCLATVTPDLGSVYALQFKLMQANLETMGKNLEQHGAALIPMNQLSMTLFQRR